MNKLPLWEYGTIQLDKFDHAIYTKRGMIQATCAEAALRIAPVIPNPPKQEKNHE